MSAKLVATNPFTGQTIAEYPALDESQLDECLEQAQQAFYTWRTTTFTERAEVLQRVAHELRQQKEKLVKLMAQEMGKPAKEGGPEVEKAAWCAEHYAEHAQSYLARMDLPSDASRSYIMYQPLGPVLGILPWNAPVWLASRFFAPALMAGNTCVMKHDPHVPGCAQAIAEVFNRAGVPEGVFVNLPVTTPMVERAIRDPRITGVSFTGSSSAGAKVASISGSEIKPTVLELGGSDPFVVLADANLDAAADVAVLSRAINAGQSCIAAKRIIVEAPVYDVFLERLQTRLAKLKQGDPMSPDTDMGPLARADLQQNLHRQVRETVDAGATCLMGGQLPEEDGYFYPVTLLTDVTESMCAFREETFGPVMVVIRAQDLEHAVSIANDTDYGLGAGVWTGDIDCAEAVAQRINAGQVAINGIVKTDPRLPSGGIKRSGFGRELGPQGIKEFANAKQVWIK